MAFDYAGTMVLRQWNALKALIASVLPDRLEIENHLEFEVSKQESFASKLIQAEAQLTGVAVSGFSGQNYSFSDLDSAAVGQQGIRGREDENLVNFLLNRRLDRNSLIPGVTAANLCAGDLPWMDSPQVPQMSNPPGAADDHHTFLYVQFLKNLILPQIRYIRETLEQRLKSALDYREQLHIRAYDLRRLEQLADSFTREVDNMFRFTDTGEEVGDPDARPFPTDTDRDPETMFEAERRSPQGTLYRNLWLDYPPTRVHPIWPATPPTQRGNTAQLGETTKPVDVQRD